MEFMKNRHILVLAALVFVLHKAHGKEYYVKCYECDSATDPKCGVQFGYKGDDGPVVKCEGKHAACKKLLTKDTPKLVEHVIRSCWNTTINDTLPEDFYTCKDVMKAGEACHCKTDFCNGQGHLAASWLFITIATLFVVGRRLI